MRCGARLEPVCPQCGRANLPEAAYCISCGASLTDAAPPARTPTPQPSPALPTAFAGGRYQVQRFLGEGGRKRVYLARTSAGVAFDDRGEHTLKGVADPQRLFAVRGGGRSLQT